MKSMLFEFMCQKFGLFSIRHYYIDGDASRVNFIDKSSCGLANTLFNVASGSITIGRGVVFGYNCMVLTGYHDYKNDLKVIPSTGFDISIGDNTWIASGSIVLGGVTIGKNCVVRAGSTVSKDIPDNCIVTKDPVKFFKKEVKP